MSHAAAVAGPVLPGTVSVAIADGSHAFEVSPTRGCLPAVDPLLRLPPTFDPWEHLAAELPALLLSDHLIARVRRLPLIDVSMIRGDAEAERATALLSFIAQAYLRSLPAEDGPATVPANLAVPWDAVARRVRRRPEISYSSAVLHNWRRIDPDRPIELGNLAVLHSFTGGGDEAWFVLVLVAAEAASAGALASVHPVLRSAESGDVSGATRHLHLLADSLDAVFSVLARLQERCDRYVWELRARPMYQPASVIMEQVGRPLPPPATHGPDLFAQSALLPVVDALLRMGDDPAAGVAPWLPAPHAAFVQHVLRAAGLRQLLNRPTASADLRSARNRCAAAVARIRAELDDWMGDDLLPAGEELSSDPA